MIIRPPSEKAADCACTVLAAYLIIHQRHSYEEALERISALNTVSLENESFLSQLRFLASDLFRLVVSGTLEQQFQWWQWSNDGQREPTAHELELGSLLKEHDRRLTMATLGLEEQEKLLEEALEREEEAGAIVQRVVGSARDLIQCSTAALREQLDAALARVGELEVEMVDSRNAHTQDEERIAALHEQLASSKREHIEALSLLLEDVTRSESEIELTRRQLEHMEKRLELQIELSDALEQSAQENEHEARAAAQMARHREQELESLKRKLARQAAINQQRPAAVDSPSKAWGIGGYAFMP